MNIAFCFNHLGLIGLGATLTSLIRNCSDQSKLNLWFFCAGIDINEKEQILKLLKVEEFTGSYGLIDFDPTNHFGLLASLHGDWTTYGRLLLADLIEGKQVLYLDTDLIVEADVLNLNDFNFGGHILAAVGGGKFRYTLGNKFYIDQLGILPDTEYFNAGVLLLNLIAWRERNVKEECLKIARQYPTHLPSHDQSLLNILCGGRFAKLSASFNCGWDAAQIKPNVADKMIVHFIGSPKPWDPLGFLIHRGYDHWLKYSDNGWITNFPQLSLDSIHRFWNIRRSYMRSIFNRVQK